MKKLQIRCIYAMMYDWEDPDQHCDFVEGFCIWFDRVMDRFLEEYELTRTEWEPSESRSEYEAVKCFVNWQGIPNSLMVYRIQEDQVYVSTRVGFCSGNWSGPQPEHLTIGLDSIAISEEWTWAPGDGMYVTVLEEVDMNEQGEVNGRKLLGFTFPNFYTRPSAMHPEPDMTRIANISMFFDYERQLCMAPMGAYPYGDIEKDWPTPYPWIYNYNSNTWAGQLSNDISRSFSSNSKFIRSQVMAKDVFSNVFSFDSNGIWNLYNNSFSQGNIVHTSDTDYLIINSYGTAVEYEEIIYEPMTTPPAPPDLSGGE